jgi:peptidoglycan/xylan/chitin deacetylase (PgdA/CDA1 family)
MADTSSTTLKAAAVRMMTASGAANLCRPLTRNAAVIFMLHRFTDPERGVVGQDVGSLRELLGYLRREKHGLVDLGTLFASLAGDAPPVHHGVAFTIDDGYLDHATIAAPVFAEFDCPVTTFVTTGFLDGTMWFWWDKIEYVFAHAAPRALTVDIADPPIRYDIGDAASRRAAQDDFTRRCKALRDAQKHDAIARLAATAEVALPQRAPAAYAPMTWDQLRAAEQRTMTFGPHTVTHPILARADDRQARHEIVESWTRLKAEATHPVPVFAYPNGQPGDFGAREFEVMQSVGLRGAVTGLPGYATARQFRAPRGQFLVPRLVFPGSLPYLIQQVNGLERLKFLLRPAY